MDSIQINIFGIFSSFFFFSSISTIHISWLLIGNICTPNRQFRFICVKKFNSKYIIVLSLHSYNDSNIQMNWEKNDFCWQQLNEWQLLVKWLRWTFDIFISLFQFKSIVRIQNGMGFWSKNKMNKKLNRFISLML